MRPLALRYGPHRANVADLWLPAERPAAHQSPAPVVVLVHGGYWRAHFTKIVMTPLALDARRRGWAVLNVEYRRLGRLGGCGRWPATFTDVATAIDHLATVDRALIDLGRVVLIGHSAGGLLALWAAGRPADTAVVPAVGVVALAPVTDLRRAATGSSEVVRLMGGSPAERADAYDAASPLDRLPIGVRQLVVHGTDDRTVPVARSRRYVARAQELGDPAELCEVAGGHRDVLRARSAGWRAATRFVAEIVHSGGPRADQ